MAKSVKRFERSNGLDTAQYKNIPFLYAPTTSHSDEETDNFYNTIDKILEKQTHYTIVMGTQMRKLENKQIQQKGCNRMIRPGPAK